MTDPFYGVSIEAASALGSFSKKSDESKLKHITNLLLCFKRRATIKNHNFQNWIQELKPHW